MNKSFSKPNKTRKPSHVIWSGMMTGGRVGTMYWGDVTLSSIQVGEETKFFLDLKKAFDTFDYRIVLQSLRKYSANVMEWFKRALSLE